MANLESLFGMTKFVISQNAIFSGFERRCILLEINILNRGGIYGISQNFWESEKRAFFYGIFSNFVVEK